MKTERKKRTKSWKTQSKEKLKKQGLARREMRREF